MTYNTAVWEKEETRSFYIYRGLDGTGSSLFKQNTDYVRENFEQLKTRGPASLAKTWFERCKLDRQVEIKCRTLDDIIREELPGVPFQFAKMDAQGAEYNILKGGESLLSGSCIGLHLELFTLPLYEGIVLLDEVESYLDGFGFRKAKQFPAHGTFDSQHDCIFLKDDADPQIVSAIKQVYKL